MHTYWLFPTDCGIFLHLPSSQKQFSKLSLLFSQLKHPVHSIVSCVAGLEYELFLVMGKKVLGFWLYLFVFNFKLDQCLPHNMLLVNIFLKHKKAKKKERKNNNKNFWIHKWTNRVGKRGCKPLVAIIWKHISLRCATVLPKCGIMNWAEYSIWCLTIIESWYY